MSFPKVVRARDLTPHETSTLEVVVHHGFRIVHEFVTLPLTVAALFYNRRIHPSYGMTWRKKFALGWRIYRNSTQVVTATSFKAHLAMAAKLLEIPPEQEGAVVECGSFLGGSALNLSLVCQIVGRELILYDSFEGLPDAVEGDKFGVVESAGGLHGSLDVVRANITKYGCIDVCTFRKGWFSDTLPLHTERIAMLFIDVDYQASMHDVLINLWNHVNLFGYVFIDEYVLLDYCAVFFSERYWERYFGSKPPGLFGAGTGVPMGNYFLGPWLATPPMQIAASVAYTFRGSSGSWDYFPDDLD